MYTYCVLPTVNSLSRVRYRLLVGVHYVFGQLQPIIFLSISQSTGQQQQQPQQQRYQPGRVSFGDAPTHRKLRTASEPIRSACSKAGKLQPTRGKNLLPNF